MPIVAYQFNKGPFLSVDSTELGSPDTSAMAKNCLLTAAGSLIDRPGLATFASVGTYPIVGMYYVGSTAVVVSSNRRIYAITSAGVVSEITGIGNLEGTERPAFAWDGTNLAIAGGGTPRVWTGTGVCTDMVGTPPDCSEMVYLDGYLIALDGEDAVWAGPTPADRAVWSAANFFQAESMPDMPIALAVCQRELYIGGQDSIEIFQNFGDSSVPFRRSFSVTDIGIGAKKSFVKADNTLFFLDAEKNFRQMQGRTPVIISTPQIDREIKSFETVTDCFGYRCDIDGSFNSVWTFPTEERTFAYDYRNQAWREFDGLMNGTTSRFRANAAIFIPDTQKHLIGDYRTGKVWEFTRESHADGDNHRPVYYLSGHIDHGTGNRKRNLWLRFHVKRGLGISGGTEPRFWVRFRDSIDGQDGIWGDPIEMTLGFEGDNYHQITLRNTGIYTKRQIEIQMTDAAALVLSKVEENVEVLAS